jgi:hypothetical protein
MKLKLPALTNKTFSTKPPNPVGEGLSRWIDGLMDSSLHDLISLLQVTIIMTPALDFKLI